MKIVYNPFAGFMMECEDGRDQIWLADMVKSLRHEDRVILSQYMWIEMDSSETPERSLDDVVFNRDGGETTDPENMDALFYCSLGSKVINNIDTLIEVYEKELKRLKAVQSKNEKDPQ